MAETSRRKTVRLAERWIDWRLATSLLFVAGFLAMCCQIFESRWETNDDVAMAMVAHGYGLSTIASPTLIFSNVLWGYLVRALPVVAGLQGYSVATLLVLLAAGSGIVYFLRRLGLVFLAAAAVAAALLLRPIVFPQFTLGAGLLAIGAVLAAWTYARDGSVWALVSAVMFAFFSFLIRWQELALIVCVALPWAVRRSFRPDPFAAIAVGVLLAAIAGAIAIDEASYRGTQWQRFQELNTARAPYTDFGVGEQLKSRPEITGKFRYTANDIDLISSFFFVDPLIADSKPLKAMVSELGAVPILRGNLDSGLQSLRTLFEAEMLPFLISGVLLFWSRPSWRLASSWMILAAILLVTGLAGRGGILRVFLPMMYLLLAGAVVMLSRRPPADAGRQGDGFAGLRERVRIPLTVLTPLLVLVTSVVQIAPAAALSRQGVQKARSDMSGLPSEVIFTWGAGLPIEYMFPLFSVDAASSTLRMYPFGVFTHAPFSVAVAEEADGNGFLQRLKSEQGLLLVASAANIEHLTIWCRQRNVGRLREMLAYSSGSITVRRLQCGDRPAAGEPAIDADRGNQ